MAREGRPYFFFASMLMLCPISSCASSVWFFLAQMCSAVQPSLRETRHMS
jgi:hypothetical protein